MEWLQEGVAVRVSMVGFDNGSETHRLLNESKDDDARVAIMRARPVEGINTNLTYQTDVTQARRLKENTGICFLGTSSGGFVRPTRAGGSAFSGESEPSRPTELRRCQAVRQRSDLTRRPRGQWIIDFG